jgi:hypothetical protein
MPIYKAKTESYISNSTLNRSPEGYPDRNHGYNVCVLPYQ